MFRIMWDNYQLPYNFRDDNLRVKIIDENDLVCEEISVGELKNAMLTLGEDKFNYLILNGNDLIHINTDEDRAGIKAELYKKNKFLKFSGSSSDFTLKLKKHTYNFCSKYTQELTYSKIDYGVNFFINNKCIIHFNNCDEDLEPIITFLSAYRIPNNILKVTFDISIIDEEVYGGLFVYIDLETSEIIDIRVIRYQEGYIEHECSISLSEFDSTDLLDFEASVIATLHSYGFHPYNKKYEYLKGYIAKTRTMGGFLVE